MPIEPQPPRYVVETSGDKLIIIIPSTKGVITLLPGILLLIIFIFFTKVLYAAWQTTHNFLINISTPPENTKIYIAIIVFIVFFLAFTLFIALPASLVIFRGLWITTGKEIITIGQKLTEISYRTLLANKSKEYWSDHIVDLRIDKPLLSDKIIKFDYGSKTFAFGKELTEAEAGQIIAIIKMYIRPTSLRS
ncbi:MAG: hypothetical protein ACOY0R_08200 [Chloroflexota bacterium]